MFILLEAIHTITIAYFDDEQRIYIKTKPRQQLSYHLGHLCKHQLTPALLQWLMAVGTIKSALSLLLVIKLMLRLFLEKYQFNMAKFIVKIVR